MDERAIWEKWLRPRNGKESQLLYSAVSIQYFWLYLLASCLWQQSRMLHSWYCVCSFVFFFIIRHVKVSGTAKSCTGQEWPLPFSLLSRSYSSYTGVYGCSIPNISTFAAAGCSPCALCIGGAAEGKLVCQERSLIAEDYTVLPLYKPYLPYCGSERPCRCCQGFVV